MLFNINMLKRQQDQDKNNDLFKDDSIHPHPKHKHKPTTLTPYLI